MGSGNNGRWSVVGGQGSGVRDQEEGKMGEELKPVTNVVKKDLISRQDAIEALDFEIVHMTAYYNGKCEGNLFAQYNKGLEDGIKAIRALPSAEPERKKGEWIKVGHWGRSYKCNQCGNYLDFDGVNAGRGDANFCPNCGARMTRGE